MAKIKFIEAADKFLAVQELKPGDRKFSDFAATTLVKADEWEPREFPELRLRVWRDRSQSPFQSASKQGVVSLRCDVRHALEDEKRIGDGE